MALTQSAGELDTIDNSIPTQKDGIIDSLNNGDTVQFDVIDSASEDVKMTLEIDPIAEQVSIIDEQWNKEVVDPNSLDLSSQEWKVVKLNDDADSKLDVDSDDNEIPRAMAA